MNDASTTLLLACLHQDAGVLERTPLPDAEDPCWDALAELAARQRIRPLVHRRLSDAARRRPVPERVLESLGRGVQDTTFRNLRYLGELSAIARDLSTRGIPLIVLKGVHLATTVYDSTSLREMSDVDVLVRRGDLRTVADVVLARGYRPLQGDALEVDAGAVHHLARVVKPHAAAIEIHWTVTPPADPHAIDPGELWGRAVPVSVGGAAMLGLCREDLLLHLCYHAAYQHQFRFGLRPFADLATLLARAGPSLDWPAIVARARAWRWDRGVHLALTLAADLVGATVPASALAQLRPAAFDPGVAAAARDHALSESSSGAINPGLARLAGRETAGARLRHLWTRVAPPRDEIAGMYGARVTSAWLPWLYVRRSADLIRRHGAAAARLLLHRDPVLSDDAARAGQLRAWLDGDAGGAR